MGPVKLVLHPTRDGHGQLMGLSGVTQVRLPKAVNAPLRVSLPDQRLDPFPLQGGQNASKGGEGKAPRSNEHTSGRLEGGRAAREPERRENARTRRHEDPRHSECRGKGTSVESPRASEGEKYAAGRIPPLTRREGSDGALQCGIGHLQDASRGLLGGQPGLPSQAAHGVQSAIAIEGHSASEKTFGG